MALTKEQILSANDLTCARVDVPEWAPPGTAPEESFVFVRVLSGTDLDQYEDYVRKHSDGERLVSVTFSQYRAFACALAMCDESGTRLFDDADAEALTKKSAAAMKRVFARFQKVNALDAKAIEALEKN